MDYDLHEVQDSALLYQIIPPRLVRLEIQEWFEICPSYPEGFASRARRPSIFDHVFVFDWLVSASLYSF